MILSLGKWNDYSLTECYFYTNTGWSVIDKGNVMDAILMIQSLKNKLIAMLYIFVFVSFSFNVILINAKKGN